MADAFEVTLAEAVLGELKDPGNADSFALAFDAARNWLPVYQAKELQGCNPKVSVLALTIQGGGDGEEKGTRNRRARKYLVVVDVQAFVPLDAENLTAKVDELCRLSQDVEDFFRIGHALPGVSGWIVTGSDRPMVYSPERLYEGVFESAVEVTLSGVR